MRLTNRAKQWAALFQRADEETGGDAVSLPHADLSDIEDRIDKLFESHSKTVQRYVAEAKADLLDRLFVTVDFGKRGLDIRLWVGGGEPDLDGVDRRVSLVEQIGMMAYGTTADEAALKQIDKAIAALQLARADMTEK